MLILFFQQLKNYCYNIFDLKERSKSHVLNLEMNRPDPDIDNKARNTIRCLNETLQNNANEPSLALYRIQVNELLKRSFISRNFILIRNIFKRIHRLWY